MERPEQLQKRKHGNPHPLDERLLRRRHITESGCWEYVGARTSKGYGNISVGSATNGTRKVRKAHSVSYEVWVGPVPEGMELDHLCRNPSCFNPQHLEPVTHQENLQRAYPLTPALGSFFNCGHEVSVDNLRPDKRARKCWTCYKTVKRERAAERRARLKAEQRAAA